MPANTRHSRSRDESMPYRYDDGGITFGVSQFSFDGGESGSPDYDERELPLYQYGDWDEVTIEGTVTVDSSVENVFPDEEGPPFPAKPVVIVDSEETQTRFEVVASDPPTDSGTYDVELRLKHELLRGKVALTPRLVRTEACRTGLPYAPNDGMRVAGGESWALLVDEPESDGRGFPFRYRDFSPEGMPSEKLVHSFSRNPNPKMMINNQNDEIVDIMQSGLTYGFRPNLKRALKADFGVALWIQLVLLTGTTIAEAGEPEFDWQEGVIIELVESEAGAHLFGEGVDYESAIDQLGECLSEPAKVRNFVTDLCEAVQLYNDYADHLSNFIDEHAP